MFNNISGINFRGGNLIINQKNGKSETISSDKITNIENIPTTNWEKFKGVYVYTEGTNIANHPVRIKNIPYEIVVDAYNKAKTENVDVQLDVIFSHLYLYNVD